LVDFLRFNAYFALELEKYEPISTKAYTDKMIYRGLEVIHEAIIKSIILGICRGHCPIQFYGNWGEFGLSTGIDGKFKKIRIIISNLLGKCCALETIRHRLFSSN
jgi:hypothetical protein